MKYNIHKIIGSYIEFQCLEFKIKYPTTVLACKNSFQTIHDHNFKIEKKYIEEILY